MKYTVEVTTDCTKWFKEGTNLRHREGGPAIERADGSKHWYLNGQRHREDGPAIEWVNGYKSWYLNGCEIKCTTQEEFLYLTQIAPLKSVLKEDCDGKVVEIDGKKYKLVVL